jgi:hypothetical protein
MNGMFKMHLSEYQMHLRVNNVTFGWSYWTLKNDRLHWDFEWNIRNKYLLFS